MSNVIIYTMIEMLKAHVNAFFFQVILIDRMSLFDRPFGIRCEVMPHLEFSHIVRHFLGTFLTSVQPK